MTTPRSNLEENDSDSVTGQCHCGGVKYTVSGAPQNVRICHCRGCQQLTGSAFFARALFHRKAISFCGSVNSYQSSPDLTRQFCSACGSLLFAYRSSAPDMLAVTLGTLDNSSAYQPECHIWIESKVNWLLLSDELPKYAHWPQST
jgi:hypothetical protein